MKGQQAVSHCLKPTSYLINSCNWPKSDQVGWKSIRMGGGPDAKQEFAGTSGS